MSTLDSKKFPSINTSHIGPGYYNSTSQQNKISHSYIDHG